MEKIYGVSFKDGQVMYATSFENTEDAQKWLRTEEYDFRERELLTAEEACEVLEVSENESLEDTIEYYEDCRRSNILNENK